MKLRGPILAAADLSDAADETLRQAQAIASSINAPLVVGHVLPEVFRVRVLFPQEAGVDTSMQAELEQKARDAVGGRMAAVLGGKAEAIAIEIDSGSPHAGLLEIAERVGAGLVVVGPGATAHRVARSALVPVLVARPSPAGGPVIGATDFSDPALPAVHTAAAEAARRGAAFRILHCLGLDETAAMAVGSVAAAMPIPALTPSIVEQLESEAHGRLKDALSRAGATGETVVTQRPAGAGIVEEAEACGAALIVVGMRGHTGLSRLALGSVAEDVISHAPCSVLAVPLQPGG